MVRQETGDQRPMAGKKSGRVQEWNGKRVTVGSGMVLCAVGRVSRMRGVQDSASGAWERSRWSDELEPKVRAWATLAFAAAVLWLFTMPGYRQGNRRWPARRQKIFVTRDGRQARLRDFRGKLVVLNFWASYCGCVTPVELAATPYLRCVLACMSRSRAWDAICGFALDFSRSSRAVAGSHFLLET